MRATSPYLDSILDEEFAILDKGFISVLDYMGNDDAIAAAARVSYENGTKQTRDNSGLINYLMEHDHTSPFEMCEIKLMIKCPIFIARQWMRHRTASINEISGRYSVLEREFYIPDIDRIKGQAVYNKQGSGDTLPYDVAKQVLDILRDDAVTDTNSNIALHELGVARELARMSLGLNLYTKFVWKIDLHNLLHFVRLRADSHAQWEINQYADAILAIIKGWCPATYNAFIEHKREAVKFSKTEMKLLRRRLSGEMISLETSGLSARAWDAFQNKLKVKQ